jgi:hypothetical protein
MLNILGYSANKSAQTNTVNTGTSVSAMGSNSSQLSPFAQMLTQLQQLEQANPTQYAQVSQQISTNLSAAASTAQTRGDTPLAKQLTSLSKDFATASQTGQLPNVNDLAMLMQSADRHQRANMALANPDSAAAATSTTAALPGAAAHSSAINIIGQVLGLARI